MRALLDVSVLLALFDQNHLEHRRARGWLEAESAYGWASCAVSQNGFLRIVSQPRYPNAISPRAAFDLLSEATETSHHAFWGFSNSVLDPDLVDRGRVLGARQITDTYLLALAVHHQGRFVTLDRSIACEAVPTARVDQLVVI